MAKDGPPSFVLFIEGMMCQKNCGTTVQKALSAVPGVVHCEVSFKEKAAKVWGSEGLELAALVDAVEDCGFEVVKEYQPAPGAPSIWAMWREPVRA
jgi:Cu+-exporting ATPase